MSASNMKARIIDSKNAIKYPDFQKKLSLDDGQFNFHSTNFNPEMKKSLPDAPLNLESSLGFDQESRSQTTAGTPKSANSRLRTSLKADNPAKLFNCEEKEIETIESTLHHLLKTQNSFGGALNDLIYNFHDFIMQLQTQQGHSEFQGQTNNLNSLLSSQTSSVLVTKEVNTNLSFPKIDSALKNLLCKVEQVTTQTIAKLSEFETFLKNKEEKSIVEVKNGEELLENKVCRQLFKHKDNTLSSQMVIRANSRTSVSLRTKGLNEASQISATGEKNDSLQNSFRKNPEIMNASDLSMNTTIGAAGNNLLESHKSAVPDRIVTGDNPAGTRRLFQNLADAHPSSPRLRLKAPVPHLNLPSRTPQNNNFIDSISDKTENFLVHTLHLTGNRPSTSRDSMSKAVELRRTETNLNKKAGLDLAISKRQDELKLGQTNLSIKRDALEGILHTARDGTLDSNNSIVKDFATGNPSTPTNNQETASFSTKSIQKDHPHSEHAVRKLIIRPGMSELQKKDLSELSFPDDSSENSPPEDFDSEELQRKSAKKGHLTTEESLQTIAQKEKAVIRSLMKAQYGQNPPSYHKAEEGRMLQRKYLLSSKWWCRWKEFVNFDAKEPISNDKQASMFKSHLYKRPGPVTNRDLILEENLIDPQSLEYELDLKPNLLEHHDFEAVSKEIFEIFVAWYGCDYEIYRVLKPDPFHDSKLFLDLYPKKKFKRKQASKSTGPTRTKPEHAIL